MICVVKEKTQTEKSIRKGYNPACYIGHACYSLIGVRESDFASWFLDYAKHKNVPNVFGLYETKGEKSNSVVTEFDTDERYEPDFTIEVSKAFPNAICYGIGDYSSSTIVCARNGKQIDEKEVCSIFVEEIKPAKKGVSVSLNIVDNITGISNIASGEIAIKESDIAASYENDETFRYFNELCSDLEMQIENYIEDVYDYNCE